MDTILETVAQAEALRGVARNSQSDKPLDEWVRGVCPQCGEALVSEIYYTPPRGYLSVHQCWGAFSEVPTCSYRRVL